MIERHEFPLSKQVISESEKLLSSNLAKASKNTRPAIEFPSAFYYQLGDQEKKSLLKAGRINVVAHTLLANRSPVVVEAAEHLEKARVGIISIYRNPDVIEQTSPKNQNTSGENLQLFIKMAEDEVRYNLTLYALTGNPSIIDKAIKKIDSVIKNVPDYSNRSLIEFDKSQINLNSKHSFINFGRRNLAFTKASHSKILRPPAYEYPTWRNCIPGKNGHSSAVEANKTEENNNLDGYLSTIGISPKKIKEIFIYNSNHKKWKKQMKNNKTNYSYLNLP
jgi:hypothetical protein